MVQSLNSKNILPQKLCNEIVSCLSYDELKNTNGILMANYELTENVILPTLKEKHEMNRLKELYMLDVHEWFNTYIQPLLSKIMNYNSVITKLREDFNVINATSNSTDRQTIRLSQFNSAIHLSNVLHDFLQKLTKDRLEFVKLHEELTRENMRIEYRKPENLLKCINEIGISKETKDRLSSMRHQIIDEEVQQALSDFEHLSMWLAELRQYQKDLPNQSCFRGCRCALNSCTRELECLVRKLQDCPSEIRKCAEMLKEPLFLQLIKFQ